MPLSLMKPAWSNSLSLLSLLWPWLFATGIALVSLLPALHPWPFLAVWLLCLLLSTRYRPVRYLSVFVTGLLWGSSYASWVINDNLSPALEGQEVQLIGHVVGVPQAKAHHVQFNFAAQRLHHGDEAWVVPHKLRLRWYIKDGQLPDLRSGEHWQLYAKLKRPHGSINPGSFDYEAWLLSQKINAVGYVRQTDKAKRLHSHPELGIISYLGTRLNRSRAHYAQFVEQASLQQIGIITALSVGLRQRLNDDHWQTLQNTGTSHLVAISGLHIGLVAGFTAWLVSWLWRRSFLERSLYPAQKVAWLAAIIAALIYAALAGFAIPTRRALLMLVTAAALIYFGRKPGPLFSLGLVAAVVLLFDPLATLNAGFWLSFTAVACIFLVVGKPPKTSILDIEQKGLIASYEHKLCNWLKRFGVVQLALFFALAPLLLLHFQQLSIASLLANLVAIPLLTFILLPALLLAFASFSLGLESLSRKLLQISDAVIESAWPFLQQLGDAPLAIWQQAPPTPLLLLALAAAFTLLIKPLGKARFIALLAFLPMFIYQAPTPERGAIWLSVLDVGQGLAITVQTQQHTLVYDAGPKYEGGFDAGASIVTPYLRTLGAQKIDAMIISHNNMDHAGGLPAVTSQFAVDDLFSAPNEGITDSRPCIAGNHWQWDGVDFRFLHPRAGTKAVGNNASCVLKISGPFGSVLLTGDIEKRAEHSLLVSSSKSLLAADVLVAPHHGSKSSSTQDFVQAVGANVVVFSAGSQNRFSHPALSVQQTYQQTGANIFNTTNTGRIAIKINSKGIHTSTYRQQKRRYWRTR